VSYRTTALIALIANGAIFLLCASSLAHTALHHPVDDFFAVVDVVCLITLGAASAISSFFILQDKS
jgi:hypothetical protein